MDLDNRNVFSHSSGGQKSAVRGLGENQGVDRATFPSESLGETLLLAPS